MAAYYYSRVLAIPFTEAVARTTKALQEEGFGIISDIDVQATLKRKIDVDFQPYRILGACNPRAAHEALELEDKIGTMLPCNVIVQQAGDQRVEVAAIDPPASMQAVDNSALKHKAAEIGAKLRRAIDRI